MLINQENRNNEPSHIQENLLSSSFILLRALKVWCRLKTHFLITELMLLYAVQSYKISDWNYPALYFIFSFIFFQRQWRTLNPLLNTRTDRYLLCFWQKCHPSTSGLAEAEDEMNAQTAKITPLHTVIWTVRDVTEVLLRHLSLAWPQNY